jgi:protein-disulfide isomerase
VELVAIHSVCLLCEGVHVASWALFYVAWRERASLEAASPSDWVRTLAPAGLAVAAAWVFVPPYWAMYSWRSGVHLPTGTEADGSPWIGAESPKVTVHEYVDYACPHCALSASRMQRLLAKNASRLRIVRHEAPRMSCTNPSNTHACAFVRGALCAGEQNRFWEMDSWLFEHGPGKVDLDVAEAARDLSLDLAKFQACVADPKTYARANEFDLAARKLHVVETPVYFIDGKRYSGKDAFPVVTSRL